VGSAGSLVEVHAQAVRASVLAQQEQQGQGWSVGIALGSGCSSPPRSEPSAIPTPGCRTREPSLFGTHAASQMAEAVARFANKSIGGGWARILPHDAELSSQSSSGGVHGGGGGGSETVEPSRCTSPKSQARFLKHPNYQAKDGDEEQDGEEDDDDTLDYLSDMQTMQQSRQRKRRAPSMPAILDGVSEEEHHSMKATLRTCADSAALNPHAALMRAASTPSVQAHANDGKPAQPSRSAQLAVEKLVSMMARPLS
jgi:hypothetical protein